MTKIPLLSILFLFNLYLAQAQNLLLSEETFDIENDVANIVPDERILYQYNNLDQISSMKIYSTNDSIFGLKLGAIKTFTYHLNGLVTSENQQFFSLFNGQETASRTHNYIYFENNCLKQETKQNSNTDHTTIETKYYNANSCKIDSSTYLFESQHSIYNYKTYYQHEELSTQSSRYTVEDNGELQLDSTTETIYNENGQRKSQRWENAPSNNIDLWLYTYDENNQPLTELHYVQYGSQDSLSLFEENTSTHLYNETDQLLDATCSYYNYTDNERKFSFTLGSKKDYFCDGLLKSNQNYYIYNEGALPTPYFITRYIYQQGIDCPEDAHTLDEPFLQMFPNPADHYITLNSTSLLKENTYIQIHDLNGRLVLDQPIPERTIQYYLPISQLSSGNYVLSLISDGKQTKQKFTKR